MTEIKGTEIDGLVERVVSDVLSSMCFAAPETIGPGTIADAVASEIRFSGEIYGSLQIGLQEGLAKQLTADFLGSEPQSVSVESSLAFTLELANVLCGAALGHAAADLRYEVSLPSIFVGSPVTPYEHCFAFRERHPELGLNISISRV